MALTDTTRNRITELIGARPSDCTPAMWDILGVLRGCTGAATITGNWSYAELAGLAACTPATARKAVRALTERGYIAVYDSAHLNRYRLSSGDIAAAERNMRTPAVRKATDSEPANTVPAVTVEPMDGITDAADRIPFPGRPMHGRRSTVRPRRTGTRLITDHATPRGRVFRLVNVERCRESARELARTMADDRGEVRLGFLARMSRDTTEAAYEPRHLATDERPWWQKAVVPVGMTTITLASIAMVIATAADAQSAMSSVPDAPEVLTGEQWETVSPDTDEPTENRSRDANDDMTGYLPTPDGEASPNTPTTERGAADLLTDGDATDVHVSVPGVDTTEAAMTTDDSDEAMLIIPSAAAASTFVTDVTGTVWEIAADGTVLGAIPSESTTEDVHANHEGSSALRGQVDPCEAVFPGDDNGATVECGDLEPGSVDRADLPLDGQDVAAELPACVGAWDTLYGPDGTPYTVNEDGRECTLGSPAGSDGDGTPSNPDGEGPRSDVDAEEVPEVGEDDSEPL